MLAEMRVEWMACWMVVVMADSSVEYWVQVRAENWVGRRVV